MRLVTLLFTAVSHYVQQNQPEGVPPLELTGERTLPDVPEENYWFRRHLAVYEWISDRVGGQRVVDLACGEGYGTDCLARHAKSVVGVEANPETFEHARLRYTSPNIRFERTLVEMFDEEVDAAVFLQTIEHVQDADAILEQIRGNLSPGGVAYISTPNVLTLAPEGKERSDNPFHIHEYRPDEYAELCRRHFPQVEVLGLFHARKLKAQEVAIKFGWDSIHPKLGITKPFYDRFVPAITSSDFALKRRDLDGSLDLLAVCRT
jgi:2-polyprenyl-3-methyl-5-hydroxy-6-metoxy-1,4-benzoquinol methylase